MSTALGGGRCTQACAQQACAQGVCTSAHGYGTDDALCAASCAQRGCAQGLVCQQDVCVAQIQRPPTKALSPQQIEQALGVTCATSPTQDGPRPLTWQLGFQWPQGARRAWIAPFVRQGTLEARRLSWAQESISLLETYNKHQFRRVQPPVDPPQALGSIANFSMDAPLLFPYAPQDQDLVVEGAQYTLEVASDEPPCLHVWFQSETQKVLALNVTLLDAGGLGAKEAPFDPAMQEALATMRRLLTAPGAFERVDVAFVDAPAGGAPTSVRSDEDLRRVTGMGRPRGEHPYWMRALDVFFVGGIDHPELPGVLGYAASLPTAPGLQGNPLQGALFSSELLGVNDVALGVLMAHEIGHLLGLRHTTELAHNGTSSAQRRVARLVGTTDPLLDTPVCARPAQAPDQCPDASNLMFPVLPQSVDRAAALEWSEAQKLILTGATQPP